MGWKGAVTAAHTVDYPVLRIVKGICGEKFRTHVIKPIAFGKLGCGYMWPQTGSRAINDRGRTYLCRAQRIVEINWLGNDRPEGL